MKVAVSCGGTGGHIFPGLVTARELQRRGHDVALWLSGKGVEAPSAAGWDGEIVTVPAEGFPSGPSLRSLRTAARLAGAFLRCRRRMREKRPDALLAMGSYASVGPVLAARQLSVSVVLHEANVIPGRAIAFLARFAAAVAVGFPETREHLRHRRVVLTGLPLRERKGLRFAAGEMNPDLFTILVTGGSQGAHALNETVSQALCDLRRKGLAFQVIHITGTDDKAFVRERYAAANVCSLVFDFLPEMEKAYAAARFAVCRAGAATCSELALFGVPALLVPFPSAIREHQLANARAMERSGAAAVMRQKDLTVSAIAEYAGRVIASPDTLDPMRAASLRRADPAAAAKLADLVESAARGELAHPR